VPSGFMDDFRRFFLRGLAAVLPTLLTVMIVVYVFRFVQNYIGVYINMGVIYLLDVILENWDAERLKKFWWTDYPYLQGVGFVLALVGIYFVGRFVASLVGRNVWRVIERGLMRAPVIKQIYPNVKQVTDFFLTKPRTSFSRVVAVEYPRKGIWSLGLVTGSGMRAVSEALDTDLLTVFIPSSPTPVTGYTITVRRDEVIDLPISIDEALRFTVSGGVVVPPAQQLPAEPGARPVQAALVGPDRLGVPQVGPRPESEGQENKQ